MKRTPLVRRTPFISRPSSRRQMLLTPVRRRDGQWAKLRVLVFARDAGRCVGCGVNLHAARWECHHRRLRSQGGADVALNLVALCGDCHRWAHSQRTESEPLGLIVPSHADPATVPVTYFDGTSRLLTERSAA